MANFGWAYVGNVISGSGGIQSSCSGSLQWATGPSTITGSKELYYDTCNNSLFLTGTMYVSGAINVDTLNVNHSNKTITNLSATGSTEFGDTTDDKHIFVGRMAIADAISLHPTTKLHMKVADSENIGGILIDFDETGSHKALYIDSEANGSGIEVLGKYNAFFKQDISNGYGLRLFRNLSESGTAAMVQVVNNNAANSEPSIQIDHNSTNTTSSALIMDVESGYAIDVDAELYGLMIKSKYNYFEQDVSNGYAAKFTRNIAEAGSEPLVYMHDDHTSNERTTLKIRQDGTGDIINLYDGGDEVFTVLNGGNTGIGVSDPDTKLEVLSTSTQFKLSYDSDSFSTIAVDSSSNLTIASAESANITLDAPGDIILDADGDQIIFKDGSTNIGHVSMESDNLTFKSLVLDKDIIFQGNDGGTTIDALTLDMSETGSATFNSNVTIEGDNLYFPGGNSVVEVFITSGGTGYSSAPTVAFSASAGSGATAVATLSGSTVSSVTVINGGSGYTSGPPTVSFSGGGGSGVTALAWTGVQMDIADGDFNLDVAGNIILDADGGKLKIKDNGTNVLAFEWNGQSSLTMDCPGDIKFDAQGNDYIFVNQGTESFRLTANGTTSATLDIKGDGIIDVDGGQLNIKDGGTDHFLFDCDDTAFVIYDDTAGADYFKVQVAANGVTTLSTNDNDGSLANLKFDADGDITLYPRTGQNVYINGINDTSAAEQAMFEFDTANPTFKIFDDQVAADYFSIAVAANGATTITTNDNDGTSGDLTFTVDGDIILGPGGGDVLPDADNTRNLGSASYRWANLYTGDLHLKNERGDWTILEEADYLCVINNKTGKKYKMMLQELED